MQEVKNQRTLKLIGINKTISGKIIKLILLDTETNYLILRTKQETLDELNSNNSVLTNAYFNQSEHLVVKIKDLREIIIKKEKVLPDVTRLKLIKVEYEWVGTEQLVNKIWFSNTSEENEVIFRNLGASIEKQATQDIIKLDALLIKQLINNSEFMKKYIEALGINYSLKLFIKNRAVLVGTELVQNNIIERKLNTWISKAKTLGIYDKYEIDVINQRLINYSGADKIPLIPPVREIGYDCFKSINKGESEIVELNIPDTVEKYCSTIPLPKLEKINFGDNLVFISNWLLTHEKLEELYTSSELTVGIALLSVGRLKIRLCSNIDIFRNVANGINADTEVEIIDT